MEESYETLHFSILGWNLSQTSKMLCLDLKKNDKISIRMVKQQTEKFLSHITFEQKATHEVFDDSSGLWIRMRRVELMCRKIGFIQKYSI